MWVTWAQTHGALVAALCRFLLMYKKYSCIYLVSAYLKGREGGRGRERDSPFTDSLPKHLQQPRLGEANAEGRKLNPVYHEGQEPMHLNGPLLSFRMCFSRKVESGLGLRFESRHSNTVGIRAAVPNSCPCTQGFSRNTILL